MANFEIKPRLEFFILFKIYCLSLLVERGKPINRVQAVVGKNELEFINVDIAYSYATKEDIIRVANKISNANDVYCDIKTPDDGTLKVSISNLSMFKDYITSYLTSIELADGLMCEEHDKTERRDCFNPIKLSKQKEEFYNYLKESGYNPELPMQVNRNHLGGSERYKRYCFEELILILDQEQKIEIEGFEGGKLLRDNDTGEDRWFPFISVTVKDVLTYGDFQFTRSTGKIRFINGSELAVAFNDGKPKQVPLFLLMLIEAQGGNVSETSYNNRYQELKHEPAAKPLTKIKSMLVSETNKSLNHTNLEPYIELTTMPGSETTYRLRPKI